MGSKQDSILLRWPAGERRAFVVPGSRLGQPAVSSVAPRMAGVGAAYSR